MRSEQSDSNEPEEAVLFNDNNLDTNAINSGTLFNKQTTLIEKLDIKPGQRRRVALGHFTKDNPTSGFSVELKPDSLPVDTVVTQISSLGTTDQYRLVMHIVNHGAQTVSAEVQQL